MSQKYMFNQSRASSVLLAIRSADFLVGNSGEWGKKWNQVSGACGQKNNNKSAMAAAKVLPSDATANPLRQSRQLSSRLTTSWITAAHSGHSLDTHLGPHHLAHFRLV